MARVVVVDRKKCNASAVCVDLCPEVFEIDEDGISVAANPRADTEENLQEAIDSCPEGAISWREVR